MAEDKIVKFYARLDVIVSLVMMINENLYHVTW